MECVLDGARRAASRRAAISPRDNRQRRSNLARLLASTSIAALGLALMAATPSRASNWDGSNSTDWFDPTNWSAGVPNAATPAVIDTVVPNPTAVGAAGAQASQLFVGNNSIGTLTILNGGTLAVSGFTVIGNAASSTGTVTVTGAGSSLASGGSLTVGSLGAGT